jgi:hypothetical protein
VVAFKVLPLGSYAPMSAPSSPFKTILELKMIIIIVTAVETSNLTILELVLWNGLQSCRRINPEVINVIKMPSFQYFLYLREQKKARSCD